MKFYILLPLLCLFLGCSFSDRDNAEQALRIFLETIANNPNSIGEYCVDENSLNDLRKVTPELNASLRLEYVDNFSGSYTYDAISTDSRTVYKFNFRLKKGEIQIYGVDKLNR